MNKNIILMNLALVLGTVVAFVFFTTQAKMKEDKEFARKQRIKCLKKFSFYYNNIFLRGKFRRIVEMYSSLSCYDVTQSKVESVKLFERNMLIAVMIPAIGAFVIRETVMVLFMAFMGIVYYEAAVDGAMDKLYVKLMTECSMTISSIREKYLETDSIPLAILYSEKSEFLEIPMQSIYRILTDTDGADRLEEFQHSYPLAIIKTLANTCAIVNENGAVKYANGGDSFSEDMTVIRQECDAEIRRVTKQKIAFNSLKTLSLAGLIIMPAAEWYLLSQIPGTASLLKGMYGVLIHAAIMIATIYAFTYISNSCRPSVVNQVDKVGFIDNLSKNRKVYSFINELIPKKFKTRLALDTKIKDSLSAMDYRYIYTAKVVYAAVGFVAAFIVLGFGTITVRDNFYNNYGSLSFIPQNLTATQQIQIKLMDDDFLAKSWEEYNAMEDADIEKMAKGRISNCNDSDANTQMKRLRTKYETYHNAVYKWWWWLVAYACAVIGWKFPEIQLSARKKLVEYEASNDVSQLQTMMIVLSETKMDVYKAICWLEKQASVHKAAIRMCHYSYIANPMKALDQLERMSPINDFKRIVRKLKASVYTLSLKDAFSDMALDKAQSLTLKEMLRNEELEQRKNSAKLIAVAPAAIALVGCFIGPVLILGISEMMDTLSSLGSFTA